jgi:hypothetical protein
VARFDLSFEPAGSSALQAFEEVGKAQFKPFRDLIDNSEEVIDGWCEEETVFPFRRSSLLESGQVYSGWLSGERGHSLTLCDRIVQYSSRAARTVPDRAARSAALEWRFLGSCQLPALLDKDTRVVEHELAWPQIFSTPPFKSARTGPGVGAGVPLVANLYRPPHRHASVN